jgi:hypothetical protein
MFITAHHLSLSWDRFYTPILFFADPFLMPLFQLTLGLLSGLLPSGFPPVPCLHLSSYLYVPYALPILLFFIRFLERYLVRIRIHEASHCVISSFPFPFHLVPLRPECLRQYRILLRPHLVFLP